jgi:hypothetical protein
MKELNKEQKWLYKKIMKLGTRKKVINMSYEDLFLTLDRVKFAYFLDFFVREKKEDLIHFITNIPKIHLTDEEINKDGN